MTRLRHVDLDNAEEEFLDREELYYPVKSQPKNRHGEIKCAFCYKVGGTLVSARGSRLVHTDCREFFDAAHGEAPTRRRIRDRY